MCCVLGHVVLVFHVLRLFAGLRRLCAAGVGVCALAGEACPGHGMSMLQRSSSRDAADIVNEVMPVTISQDLPSPSSLSLMHGSVTAEDKEKSCAGQPNLGITAVLDEQGFFLVREKCCPTMMVEFIRRLIEAQDATAGVCDEGSLHGLSHFFDCTDDDISDFDRLMDEIKSDAAMKGDCPWVGYPSQTGGCPARSATCPSFPGATSPPCKATAATSTVPPNCFEQDTNYMNFGNDLDPNPGSGAQSEQECQQFCAAEPQCTHFSFRTLRHSAGSIGCWLKNYQAPPPKFIGAIGIISGPKIC